MENPYQVSTLTKYILIILFARYKFDLKSAYLKISIAIINTLIHLSLITFKVLCLMQITYSQTYINWLLSPFLKWIFQPKLKFHVELILFLKWGPFIKESMLHHLVDFFSSNILSFGASQRIFVSFAFCILFSIEFWYIILVCCFLLDCHVFVSDLIHLLIYWYFKICSFFVFWNPVLCRSTILLKWPFIELGFAVVFIFVNMVFWSDGLSSAKE